MATLYDKFNTGDDTNIGQTTTSWHAMTFTVVNTFTIGSVKLKLYTTVAPDYVVVSIRATDGTIPIGLDLVSGELAGSELGGAPGSFVEITFTDTVTLTAGTKYAIVVRPKTSGTSNWRQDTNGGYITGRRCNSSDSGLSWTEDTAVRDLMFECYGGVLGELGTVPVDKTYSRKLIAIGNGEVWQEKTADPMEMEEITTATGLDTVDVLNAAVLSQKLFIVNGTIKKVLDLVNTKLYDAAPALTVKPTFGQRIYQNGADPATMIVDFIDGDADQNAHYVYGKVISGTFETGAIVTTVMAGGDTIMTPDTVTLPAAGPHWYDWTPYNNDETTYGSIPDKIYQICRYRGRLQLSGDPDYPHQWYQSRQLNPFDFLFAPGDAQSPVHGNQADCAEVGDIVKVAIPYSDDILVYGCANELWVMHGDAAFGGELNPLDTTTGILGDRAWCWDDIGNLYMAGTAGLLRIPRGFGDIENLTRELWPDFIEDLAFDSSLHRITLAFDPEKVGIHIFKTTLASGACTAWWWDLRVEGLFPDAIPTAMGIYSAFYYQTESPLYRKLLVGCADGYIKSFDKDTVNDDGTLISSYVGFAPLALSIHSRKDGIIKNIDIVTGIGDTDSNNVTCTVHVARTAGQVIKKLNDGDTAAMTKVFIAPNWTKSNLDRRSIRGQWAAIVLTNSALAESWSMERLIVDSKEIGRSL